MGAPFAPSAADLLGAVAQLDASAGVAVYPTVGQAPVLGSNGQLPSSVIPVTALSKVEVQRQGAAQSIANNTLTAVQFDTVITDDGPYYAAGQPTRLTVPTGTSAGYYLVFGSVGITGASSRYSFGIRKNGASGSVYGFAEQTLTGAGPTTAETVVGLASLTAGDYVEMVVWQNSGGALNTVTAVDGFAAAETPPNFGMVRIA